MGNMELACMVFLVVPHGRQLANATTMVASRLLGQSPFGMSQDLRYRDVDPRLFTSGDSVGILLYTPLAFSYFPGIHTESCGESPQQTSSPEQNPPDLRNPHVN